MASKREFKKNVDRLGSDIIENMMVAWYNAEGADKKGIADAMGTLLKGIEAARNNSNLFFDRGAKAFPNRREYGKAKEVFFKKLFTKIIADLNTSVSDSLKQFNAALPKEVKEANKEGAN
ncbi:MAG: hypothetical protein K2N03_05810 [Muribaculaceae bacterium]|nr:hypothetical protein [Muribaculaceae bacterium]